MTARGAAIAAVQRSVFEALAELDKTAPADVDQIIGTIIKHVRSWRPESVSPLGTRLRPLTRRQSAIRGARHDG